VLISTQLLKNRLNDFEGQLELPGNLSAGLDTDLKEVPHDDFFDQNRRNRSFLNRSWLTKHEAA
jgi:hypothetical protein